MDRDEMIATILALAALVYVLVSGYSLNPGSGGGGGVDNRVLENISGNVEKIKLSPEKTSGFSKELIILENMGGDRYRVRLEVQHVFSLDKIMADFVTKNCQILVDNSWHRFNDFERALNHLDEKVSRTRE